MSVVRYCYCDFCDSTEDECVILYGLKRTEDTMEVVDKEYSDKHVCNRCMSMLWDAFSRWYAEVEANTPDDPLKPSIKAVDE